MDQKEGQFSDVPITDYPKEAPPTYNPQQQQQPANPQAQAYPPVSGYGQPQAYGQPYSLSSPSIVEIVIQGQTNQAVIVSQPGYPGVTTVVTAPPPNHAALAWLTCLFCFWPLGLAAIIKSNEVDSASRLGDMNRAHAASKSARQFSLISIGLGILAYIIVVVIIVIRVRQSSSVYYY
eukprot:gene7226-8034_t